MAEIKCPHCGQAFTVDDTELGSVENQVISVPINIRLNQYFGEQIVEYEG